MRILVTRPEPDAQKTAARLRVLGHEPVIASLLTVVFTAPPDNLPAPAALILTSRNAARAVSRWPQASAWRDRPVFVTGRGTGEAAASAGFTNIKSAEGDASDLARLLMSDSGPRARPILHPAARDRSEAFLECLRGKGFDIQTIEAYRAEVVPELDPAVRDALRAAQIDAVVIYSRRTAEAFRQAVEHAGLSLDLARIRLYALSDRVAEPLVDLGAEIVVAKRPDEESLLSALRD
jgi:uroporphyrinogen-III synthase